MEIKKSLASLLAIAMLAGCSSGSAATSTAEASSDASEEAATAAATAAADDGSQTKAAPAETGSKDIDKLTFQFVPSKDADVIITGTAGLDKLVIDEMASKGYNIGSVDISVGTSYEATGEALAAGTIDVGWLPGGTYALYSDECDVVLTATRNGLSNDSTNPADWNGEANATKKDGPQVTYYRSLIYATPSEYGKQLAEKVNNGEALTWDDLNQANWGVMNVSSSAGYIYPSLWLMNNYDGKKITDLDHVQTLDSYGSAFQQAAAESLDIIVCYADGRNDYEAAWTLPTDQQDDTGKQGMGRSDSIWNELNVIGVGDKIYNDTVAVTMANPDIYNTEFITALQDSLIDIIGTEEGKNIFSVYSHTGYQKAVDSDYDIARAALKAVDEN
ncbi:PhnD/SsuA/transferrin family substrate-binding protein [Erysipelotrichaceae bacterium Oil+RF-744-GAM-WT-6]|jgi:phosphonate transport system substrate-binding protein|uniref:PhnD/SsuA/transferrin family substrate-binding protein n=1 Tax=Stecheria intestinalis TaxID=2606630 RepID=A0A7X2THH9_9FIRM|nr:MULTISPECIES: PhnD/SsuA/transferrin family substrate-binding protein [Erysipelotrichaceae]MDD5881634.1 PhnD/SsuA/transferrin family substrate-binding protein [Stecheria intestinalis]MDD6365722.1 PhnD/SsuA/transferrin family substrate-binding protein [Stecheria intestinalis]MDY4682140.1 PhnD/SsuA/transferrin family substrate-binding protein [Lachnospiraceae bacterium]MSS59823.1 PhnD/SsuA/transferrin family substrate-binding protein [Stecheria intestinalis]